jgi:hypothetical protein
MATTETPSEPAPEQIAAVLRERVYGGIACLSTLLVLVRPIESGESPWDAVLDVAIAAGGLWAASLFADYVAHIAAHGKGMSGAEAMVAARASGQILEASAIPLVLLVIAGFGWLPYHAAVVSGVVVSIVELGLFALLTAHRAELALWKRAVLVLALLALGTLVVALKTLAH